MTYNHFRYARKVDANNIGIYNGSSKLLNIDSATANATVIEGLSATGKLLYLKANETDDNPKIILDGNSGNINAQVPLGSDFFGVKQGSSNTIVMYASGSIHFVETTTPTPIANYGAIYAKSDNKLYFQDGAGVEHTVTIS